MNPVRKATIDWLDVRQRMERAQEATEKALATDLQQAGRSLQERARVLALPLEETAKSERVPLAGFRLGDERYAIEARYVREIFMLRHTTPLPLAPPPFIALANLRGEILPVVDLGQLVGLETGEAERPFAVALGQDGLELAIAVTAVDEAIKTPLSTLQQSGPLIRGQLAEWQLGVTSDAIIVLDGGALLADPRLACEAGRIEG